MIGIYKITNPKGKIYIGQSVDIEKRFKEYKYLKCKTQRKLYNSLNKYGFENHIFEIIIECDVIDLNSFEREYQEQYDVLSNNGLNLKLTETKDKSGYVSDETKKNASLAKLGEKNPMFGRKMPDSAKTKISENKLGVKRSKESIEKQLNNRIYEKGSKHHNFGKKMSEETKAKISESQKLRLGPKKVKHKKCRKKIILDLETGIYYIGTEELALLYGFKLNSLRSKLNGKMKNNTQFIYV